MHTGHGKGRTWEYVPTLSLGGGVFSEAVVLVEAILVVVPLPVQERAARRVSAGTAAGKGKTLIKR